MRRLTIFRLNLLAILVLGSSSARPFTLWTEHGPFCTSGAHWLVHGCPTTECGYSMAPIRERCGVSHTPAQKAALAWGLWMWNREGALTKQIFWQQEQCSSSWDELDQTNVWRYTTSSHPDFLNGKSAAVHMNTTDICGFSGHEHIYSFDLAICAASGICGAGAGNEVDSVPPLSPGNHDTLSNCLSPLNWWETTVAHEAGHAYGAGHDNTRANLMRSNATERICHVGDGFRVAPDADSMAAASFHQGRNTENIRNLAASPWLLHNDAAFLDTTSNFSITAPFAFLMRVDLQFYYARPLTFLRWYHCLVPETITTPTPAHAICIHETQRFSSSMTGILSVASTVTVPPSLMAPGQIYRLWTWVDPLNEVLETDEGDNWAPTGHLFRRQ